MNLSLRDHMKPALKQLHSLPVEQRITYKLCLFMHHIHIRLAPKYLSDCVSTVSAARLRSAGSFYVLPRTRTRFGERGFFCSGPAAWNTLPSDLHDITDISRPRKRLLIVLITVLLALLDVSYSGALQIARWLIDRLIRIIWSGLSIRLLNTCHYRIHTFWHSWWRPLANTNTNYSSTVRWRLLKTDWACWAWQY